MINQVGAGANVRRWRNDTFDVFPRKYNSDPTFTIKTLEISRHSSPYLRDDHCYGGVIIYGHNGKKAWTTANGTRCKSGYVVIMQTDTEEFRELQEKWSNEPGKVHGIIYKKAFGESCKDQNVVGEGFGIIDGEFRVNSGALNAVSDGYHDGKIEMNINSRRFVEALVDKWKSTRSKLPRKRNYKLEELQN